MEAHRGQVDGGDALGDAAVHRIERRHVFVHGDEHQPLPGVYAQRRQADIVDVEIRGTLHLRRAAQLAFQRVGPAVVLAVQRACALAVAQRQRAGTMAAHVRKGAQHTVLPAHHQHRHAGHVLDDVIARLGQLTRMRDQLPAAPEHRFLFQRQGRLAGVVAGRQRPGAFEGQRVGGTGHGIPERRRPVERRPVRQA